MPQAPEFWQRRGLLSDLLLPLAWGHAALSAARRQATRPWYADVPVLCVGNLVAGGAGKTPVVLSLARLLTDAGRKPHILSRGYGGRLRGPLRVDPARHTASEVGDEPLLLARAAPTWIGSDRVASARAASAAGAELLVLDDGFQNPALHYDLSLLVVDGSYGLGNGRVIPAGPLREPAATGLARAQAVVLIGDGDMPEMLRGVTALRARLLPVDAAELGAKKVVAFAGIGRPEKFFTTLEELGAILLARRAFPDHHAYSEAELAALAEAASREGAVLVTTEKDCVRISPPWRERVRALAVTVDWADRDALTRFLAVFSAPRDG